VIAFAGETIGVDEVSAVLGLVGRDLLFDVLEAVVAEDGPRALALADRAIETGHDLKLVCRELTRVVRDMMLLSVDPSRASDGELSADEVERLRVVGSRFSREDLMRAFDLLADAEQEIRTASQPRYHFEMMLVRWMHLRKLVPLSELMEQMGKAPLAPTSRPPIAPAARAPIAPAAKPPIAPSAKGAIAPADFKDSFLAEIRRGKQTLYELAVAQARRVDVTDDQVTFTFPANQKVPRTQLEQNRAWLEAAAERVAGRRIKVVVVQADPDAAPQQPAASSKESAPDTAQGTAAQGGAVSGTAAAGKRDLKAEAMASSAVQAMLDVFPAQIRDVEEM
jgi:DNA polymerase III gamma/tau subunit